MAIYSKFQIRRVPVIDPVNGLHCEVIGNDIIDSVYGNVVTIKDRWSSASTKTYNDRLDEQINAIKSLPNRRSLVAGDFNLRLGWPQKKPAYNRIKKELVNDGWVWPTMLFEQSVQHILHTPDLIAEVTLDHEVKYDSGYLSLSDHPFVLVNLSLKES